MYSDNKNIQQLAYLLREHGVTDAILCPGSRNAAIVHTLSQMPEMHCHAITDERSAGFFALGIALQTGRPTAICVTSGSALLNLHPAVAEAFYQHVPLIVISADRPAAWIGQMDGQTLPQPNALGNMVRVCVTLPEPNTKTDEWHANRLINEALMECTHRAGGPVHINIPISEPIYEFHTENLPAVRKIERIEGLSPANCRKLASLLEQTDRRMIIVGQKAPDRSIMPTFLNELNRGFVSLTENLSNLGPGHVALEDPETLIGNIPEEKKEDYRPDLVITMGGHIVSKSLKQFLRKHPPHMHWHVDPDGQIADTFCCLTHVIEAHPYDFLQSLAMLMLKFDESGTYPAMWQELAANTRQTCPTEACKIVGKLMQQLPENAVLHLANSSTVRYAQHYPIDPSITVCCNRGVNGIEGSVSTAVGYATADPLKPNFLIIGDLSFFYDQNGLWNQALPQNLHILLLNNGGGEIFKTLPIPQGEDSCNYICATHTTEVERLCQHYGIDYLSTSSDEELTTFINHERTILLEWKETGNR